jgi:AraC-like DNA-binding protein
MTENIKDMLKPFMAGDFLLELEETGMVVGEPPSLHHGGAESLLTAIPHNILVWLYDNAPSHYMHSRFAMGISLRGGCVVGVDGQEFQVTPGTGILIFPFQAHYIIPSEPGNMINLAVTFALRNQADNSLLPLRDSVFHLAERDREVLQEIALLGKDGALGQRSVETAHLLELFLCRKLEEKLTRPEADSIKSADSSLYAKIVAFIRSNLSSPLTAKDISRAVGLSVPHIRRVFNSRTGGLNLARFILSLRVKQAYEMLMHTDLTVAEIGEKCGFSDQFVFSRAFKRIAGLSPANYRKQH